MTAEPLLALAAAPPARPSFGGAMRAEVFKLRHNRPTWVITGFGLGVLILMTALFATEPSYQSTLTQHPLAGFYSLLHPLQGVLAAGGGIAVLLSGGRLLGMEFDLGTVRTLLARGTGRQQLLAAKLSALALYALFLLIGFSLLAAVGSVLAVQHQVGSLSALEHLPPAAWENLGLAVLSCGISLLSCVFLSVGMAALLRSVTGGMLLAILFFPVDNGLAVALGRLSSITRAPAWREASALLLGPNLNRLPTLLQVHETGAVTTLTTPAVPTSLGETALVIAGWWLLLLLVAMASMGWRDVLN